MSGLVFLFDVDNTLIDNDRVKRHMEGRTRDLLGAERAGRFWQIYEEVRREWDFVDFPRTLERYSETFPDERNFPQLASELLCYPYRDYLFPRALEVIEHARRLGVAAIVSDGDRVFQPAKIGRSGLAEAVGGQVLIFTHKDTEFDQVEARLPARRYVIVDDKPSILEALKRRLGERAFTVHVRQGKYARDRAQDPPADLELGQVAELLDLDAAVFGGSSAPATGRG